MKIFRFMASAILLLPFCIASLSQTAHKSGSDSTFSLNGDWAVQSSVKVDAKGEAIATSSFQAKDWIKADVPTTVVAAQVKSGLLPDPFFGMNLRQYPGVSYPIGANFSNLPMPPDSPYAVSWWYRKSFRCLRTLPRKTVWLNFRGINYRGNIWLNGKQIANSNDVAGAWRTYEFNVTSAVKPGVNVLAAQIWAPTDTSLAITFVDWNPAPPDKNMGLWREVYLTTSGPVAVRYPAVVSKVDSPANQAAHLTVTALLKNGSDHPVKGTLRGKSRRPSFRRTSNSPPAKQGRLFRSGKFPQLNSRIRVCGGRRRWARRIFTISTCRSRSTARFPIPRTASSASARSPRKCRIRPERYKRLFTVNGKKLLIRGAGWTPDMMLRTDPQRMADEFRYVQDMGLNTVRLEGKLEPELSSKSPTGSAFW